VTGRNTCSASKELGRALETLLLHLDPPGWFGDPTLSMKMLGDVSLFCVVLCCAAVVAVNVMVKMEQKK